MNSTQKDLTAQFTQLRKYLSQDHNEGWEKAWKTNTTPWDSGDIQPALRELIESKAVKFPTTGCALVPGCGQGYDAGYIAGTLGLSVLAVDISETAVNSANKLLSDVRLPPDVKVEIALKDFFTGDLSIQGKKQFDLVYDYTFFVALPPARRPEWGRRMTEIVRGGGYLVTLVYPIDPPVDYGPPYFVRPEHYERVLSASDWEKVYDKIPEKSLESHVGRERMVVWRRL